VGLWVFFRYYGVVTMIPIFQYSNVYASTPKLHKLTEDYNLQEECISFVSKSSRQPPSFKDVFMFYASMNRGTTVKDLCIRFNPHAKRINERKLVQFGMLRGLIHRIHRVRFATIFYITKSRVFYRIQSGLRQHFLRYLVHSITTQLNQKHANPNVVLCHLGGFMN